MLEKSFYVDMLKLRVRNYLEYATWNRRAGHPDRAAEYLNKANDAYQTAARISKED